MEKGLILLFLFSVAALFFCLATHAETTFTEVSAEAGIEDQEHGYSAAFIDYDNDGDLDIHVSNWGWHHLDKPNKLYRNNGDGTFTDVAEEAGIVTQSGTANTIFGDYDNDGDVDLYLVNGAGKPANVLYKNNGDGTFTDVTKEADVRNFGDGKIGVFWDYDNDGHLDIYATTWGQGSALYKNNGDGTFTSISREVIGVALPTGGHAAAVGDYDNDGDLDLFTPYPFKNNGDGTFTNATIETKIQWSEGRGGVTIGDYNNDGHLDAYIAIRTQQDQNRLYKNNGDGIFTEVAQKAGVANSSGDTPVFVDYDNDGYLDLYVAPGLLYRNNGNETFDNVIEKAGIEPATVGVWFSFAGLGDYDNDGDLDVYLLHDGDYSAVVGPSDELFRNNGNDNHWLHIKTVGTQSNRDGIGARVTVKAGDLSQIRDVVSEWARSCPPVQFGLGKNAKADEIEIRWPSGQVTTLTNVGADRMIQVTEGEDVYKVLHRGLQIAVEPAGKQLGTWASVKRTELFQNFPNPSNPETWIPFTLAKSEEVTIKIYGSTGKLVRTMELGRKDAGDYLSREKAAYWDGKNESGETVASDVYFYQMRAGESESWRKMVMAR